MPLYYYKAVTKNGRVVKNKVEDMSRISLLKKLKRNGLIPITVIQTAKRKNTSRKPKKNLSGMSEIVKNASANTKLQNKSYQISLKERVYGKLALTEKVTLRDIIIFTQNFYLLKKANFNNIHALSTVIENTENLTLKEILEDGNNYVVKVTDNELLSELLNLFTNSFKENVDNLPNFEGAN